MAIDLSNYVEVAERIGEFFKRYPEGSYQTDIVELPPAFADKFIAVQATVYRTPDDLTPGIEMAWEPVPGKTPYTKDSELQNACTSAIGRAIVAIGAADTRRGIASREEVAARQPQNRTRASDSASGAPETDGEDYTAYLQQWVATQKQRLLDAFDGDKEQAKNHWTGLMSSYGIPPGAFPIQAARQEIEDDITLMLAEIAEPVTS